MTLDEIMQGMRSFLLDSPINQLKWGIVIGVIIVGYVVLIKSKVISKIFNKWEYRRDIAISRNHVVEATLISEYPYGEAPDFEWHAKYLYTVNGKELKHNAIFRGPARAPKAIKLYYVDNPKRTFSTEENLSRSLDAVLVLILVILPIAAGIFVANLFGL